MKKVVAAIVAGLVMSGAIAHAESTNITGSLMLRQNLSHVFTDNLGISTTENLNSNAIWNASFGSGAGSFNTVWSTQVSVTNNQSKTFDLIGGLTNRFGKTVNIGQIKWFQVSASSANRGSVRLGDELAHWNSFLGGTNQSIILRPGVNSMMWVSGTNNYSVTATTGDLIKFTNLDSGTGAYANVVQVFVGGVVQ